MMNNLNEEQTYSDKIDLQKEIKSFLSYLTKNNPTDIIPEIKYVNDDIDNASTIFGKTAFYDPNNNSITLYIEGRHPSDILKSLAHEYFHYIQNQEGRLQNITTDNITEDDNLAELEREAYEFSGMMFRKYKDSKKAKKLQEEYKAYALNELFEKDLPNITKISPVEYIVGNGDDIEARYIFKTEGDSVERNWSIHWSFTLNNTNDSPESWKQVTATSYKVLQDFINDRKPISISISGDKDDYQKTNIYKSEKYLEKLKTLLNNKYRVDNPDEEKIVLTLIETKAQMGILKRMETKNESYEQSLHNWQDSDINARSSIERWSAIQKKVKREILQELYNINENYKIPIQEEINPKGTDMFIISQKEKENIEEVCHIKDPTDHMGLKQFGYNIGKKLGEELEFNQQPYKIFIDLDETLVAFDDGFKEIFGMSPSSYEQKYGRPEVVAKIESLDVNFWNNLKWLQNGKALWNYIKKYNPTIITAPSSKSSEIGKRKWINYNLGTHIPVIFAKADKKANYSGEDKILIDDLTSTIYQWIDKGGIGIHFISVGDIINKLKKLGL